MAEQPFERGHMFWRSDLSMIYVLNSAAGYLSASDFWVGPAEYSCEANPPAGLLQPKRGFGLVWCSMPKQREALGWALEEERGFRGALQNFERGLMILTDRGLAYALTSDGAWTRYGP